MVLGQVWAVAAAYYLSWPALLPHCQQHIATRGQQVADNTAYHFSGMWDYMVEHCNGGVKPSLADCFYVGDAAGRPADHSSVDKDFAAAVGIKFFTPEEKFGERAGKVLPPKVEVGGLAMYRVCPPVAALCARLLVGHFCPTIRVHVWWHSLSGVHAELAAFQKADCIHR